MLRSSYHND